MRHVQALGEQQQDALDHGDAGVDLRDAHLRARVRVAARAAPEFVSGRSP